LANFNKFDGIIDYIKSDITDVRSGLEQLTKDLKVNNKLKENPTLELIKNSTIDPRLIKSILLHTDESYLNLINDDSCFFYSLLDAKLIKSSLGTVTEIPIIENEVYLVSSDSYTSAIYQYKCKHNNQLKKLFNRQNLLKTMSSLDFQTPKTKEDCQVAIKKWKKDHRIPYLCAIPMHIKDGDDAKDTILANSNISIEATKILNDRKRKGEYYKSQVNYFKRTYISGLCKGFKDQKLFCSSYLTKDAWSKSINGEIKPQYMNYVCREYLNKKPSAAITKSNIRNCAGIFRSDSQVCTTLTTKGFLSLYPKPNCNEISKAFNLSRLRSTYKDCTAQVDNNNITNTHRIINHYKEKFIPEIQSDDKSCSSFEFSSLAKIYEESKISDKWPLNICYKDKIENKEICQFYIPGHLKEHKQSEEKVVSKILYRIGKIGRKAKCKISTINKYNPALMRYKTGCHIIYDSNLCNSAYCPRKIIINEKIDKSLTYKGKFKFDYFPTTWKKQKYSVSNILEDRFDLKKKKLENLTQLENFLKENKQSVIHGVGCVEDILPTFFNRTDFNQCRPITFIIDNIFIENDNKMLVVRTSLDDLYAPRLISWNWIFTAIMGHKNLHPLNSWSLYGIKN
jgi:hypothetical protein